MKQHVRFILSVVCLMGLLAVCALAQEQDINETKKRVTEKLDAQIRDDMVKVVGAKFGFETKVVKGAPYSATAEAETVQTLADGNRITSKTTSVVYRDGEGRTRRENMTKAQAGGTMVFLNDPVAGTRYTYEMQKDGNSYSSTTRVLTVDHLGPPDLDLVKMKMAKEKETLRAREARTTTDEGVAMKQRAPVTESLGKQMIEGLECEGTRTTVTIPAGKIGNDLPINIVSEEWYSPELQVLVLTKQNDPRTGETTYRLTNINRSEPDHSLFEPPAGVTIQHDKADKFEIKATMKKKPEEDRQ